MTLLVHQVELSHFTVPFLPAHRGRTGRVGRAQEQAGNEFPTYRCSSEAAYDLRLSQVTAHGVRRLGVRQESKWEVVSAAFQPRFGLVANSCEAPENRYIRKERISRKVGISREKSKSARGQLALEL